MTEDTKPKLSKQEEDEIFRFDDKTLDNYEDDVVIDQGEYLLEVANFARGVTIVTEENLKEGRTLGEKIPWARIRMRHAKDKAGKVDQSLVGRSYETFFWDLRREETRNEVGSLYRAFGYDGEYVPKYQESEFISGSGDKKVARKALFYISKYQDSQTKRDRNGRPKVVDKNSKTKKQERKDAKGPIEI